MTDRELHQLKACPFCGKFETLCVITPSELHGDDCCCQDSTESWSVICDASAPRGCGASGGFFETEDAAVRAWNRREVMATSEGLIMSEFKPVETVADLEQPVKTPERAEFMAWLRAYAGGGDHWRGNVLMGEHDIALAIWKDMQRQLARVRSEQRALRIAHHCMAPACPGTCSGCNHALSSDQVLQYAKRYAWLRERDLNAVHDGGVFAGMTPLNVVLNGTDLDEAIDAGMQSPQMPRL